jgi:peptidoglycan/xylan/chitin deacetylase (PgdA/CDA1 family)
MKNIFLKFILTIILLVGAGNVFASVQVPILVYHSFGPAPSRKETPMQTHYRVTAETFEKQMKYLKDNGYHPITFTTYVDSFRNYVMKLPNKPIVLSFDDGWKTQYKYAVPILEKYNFPATFFIISNYASYGSYMNWNDLKDLVAHNFGIGSHTETHSILTKVNTEQLTDELTGSKKILEDKLGIKITTLAYPDYAQNETVQEAVKSAGYSGARAGWAKFNNSIDYIYQLKSQEVVNNPDPFSDKRLPDLP